MKPVKTLHTGILAMALAALVVLPGCKNDSATENTTYGSNGSASSAGSNMDRPGNSAENDSTNNGTSQRTSGDSTGVNTASSVNGSAQHNPR